MNCEIIIDRDCEERVVIYAQAHTPLVEDIRRLAEENGIALMGYRDREIVRLNPLDVYCFAVLDNKVYAVCENEQLQLKQRLYQIEGLLPDGFVKINQSCIANLKKVERFDASISGTLKLRFKNGYVDYVSRRQLKCIKERLGI